MKYWCKTVWILLMFSTLSAFGQQDPQFSQFMFNKDYFVPALVAADGRSSLTLFSRSQWVGYEASFNQKGGPPSTQFISYAMPMTLLKIPINTGANLIYDKLGPSTTISFQPTIAYDFEFPRGILKFGLRPTINNYQLDFTAFDFVNTQDIRNRMQIETNMTFDLDFGVAYTTDNYVLGLGISHILQPDNDYGLAEVNGSSVRVPIIYSVYGDYLYQVSTNVSIGPSALIQTDINAFSYNIGLIATYSERMWAGISYRDRESVVLLLGYSFLENQSLRFGYSFDYIIDEREAKSISSHEIHLKYFLPSISTGAKKIIRTPRFRF